MPRHSSNAAPTTNSHLVCRHSAPNLVKTSLLAPPAVSELQPGFPTSPSLLRPHTGSQQLLVAISTSTQSFGTSSRAPFESSTSLPTSRTSNIPIRARANAILPSEGQKPISSHVRPSTESSSPQIWPSSERLSPLIRGLGQSLSLLQLAYRPISSNFTESSPATLVDSDLSTASACPAKNQQKYLGKRRPQILPYEPTSPTSPAPEDGVLSSSATYDALNQTSPFDVRSLCVEVR